MAATTWTAHTNNVLATLDADINDSVTACAITLSGGAADFPNPATNTVYATISLASDVNTCEVVKFTTYSAGTVSVMVRAQQGTAARAWSAGDTVALVWTKADADAIEAAVNAIEDGSKTLDSVTVTGAATAGSAVIGGGYGNTGTTISAAGAISTDGTITTDSTLVVASSITAATAEIGGGYGASGVSISTDGVIQADGQISSDTGVTVGDGTGDPLCEVDGAAEEIRGFKFQTAGDDRFALAINGTAESGSDAGSDLVIINMDDAGTPLGFPMTVTRSTGDVTIANDLAITGALSVGGDATPGGWHETIPLGSLIDFSVPPAALAATTANAGIYCRAFDAASDESLMAQVQLPDTYAGEDLTFTITWIPPTADTVGNAVRWQVFARILTDNTVIPSSVAVTMPDAFQTLDLPHVIKGTVTPGGAADGGNIVTLQIKREATSVAGDTYAYDAELVAVSVAYA